MDVVVIGTGGSSFDEANPRPCSSYLVSWDDAAVLLDCGPGTFASFEGLVPRTRLDAIVLSHRHRDHVGDLAAFLAAPCWRGAPRVVAHADTLEGLSPLAADPDAVMSVAEESRGLTLAGVRLDFDRTAHQVPTLAVCLSGGRHRVVYGADTGPGWRPPAAFRGADLAIIECTFAQRAHGDSPFHLDAGEAASLARFLAARRTILGHVPPGEDVAWRLRLASAAAPELSWVAAETGQRLRVD